MKVEFLNGVPPETIASLSDSGYINSELFINSLQHFKKHTKPSQGSPVLLILYNHSSHINLTTNYVLSWNLYSSCEYSTIFKSSNEHSLLIDVFFKPLKDHYEFFYDLWIYGTTHTERTVTLYQVCEIFGQTYAKIETMEKALNWFEMCLVFNPKYFYIFFPAIHSY